MKLNKTNIVGLLVGGTCLLLTLPAIAYDGDTTLLASLKSRMTPGEWEYFKLMTKPAGFWKSAGDALPWLTAAFAILSLLLQQHWQRKRDRESQLYNGLSWFEGGTQKRSIGIALIEANWEKWKGFHATWNAVLTNQAIYLMNKSDSLDVPHEENNFFRIVDLLRNPALSDGQKANLSAELAKKIERAGGRPGLDLTHRLKDLNQWKLNM